MKRTKRKAFSFLRSYFDVLNKLQTDEDKLSFLNAIINKQFLNEDPVGLKFPVDLAWDSQINSIDNSVKGWIRAERTDLQGNSIDTPSTPPQGKTSTHPKEEEEEEKEEGKDKYIITDEKKFLVWFNSRRTQYINQPSNVNFLGNNEKANLRLLKKNYKKEDMEKAMRSFCSDEFYKSKNLILPTHFLEHDKFIKFLNASEKTMGQKLAGI
jgi:hypothetical protein